MLFGLFGKKELGHYTEIHIEGLNTTYTIHKRGSNVEETVDVRLLLANDDAIFTVYGVEHTPYVSAVCIDDADHFGERIPAIMISNKGLKRLRQAEIQVLVDYEMLRWNPELCIGKASSNCQSDKEEYNPEYPDIYSVYEASTKTRKLKLVAEYGKVARRAFMKNEKSLLNLPKEAYRNAEKCRKMEQEQKKVAEEEFEDDSDVVVDLAGACS